MYALCLILLLGSGVEQVGWAQQSGSRLQQAIDMAQEVPRERAEQEPMYVFKLVNGGDAIDTVSLRLLDPSTFAPIMVGGNAICNPCGYVLQPGRTEHVNLDTLLAHARQQAQQRVHVIGLLSAGPDTRITLTYGRDAPIEPLHVEAPWAVTRKAAFRYRPSDN